MKVIVTGANGFLGKLLINELLNRKHEVVALDVVFDECLLNDSEVFCLNTSKIDSVENVAAALPDGEYDCFFHLAWAGTSGPARSDYDVQLSNVRTACKYVELSKKIHCKRFLYASSISEMETYEYLQSDNVKPSGGFIYGTGKLAAHFMAETVAKANGIDFIPMIITNIYGVGEKSARLIYTSLVKLIKGEHCSFTEGDQMYDFIYVSDAINSMIEIAKRGKAFNRYYIGSGNPKPLREFLVTMRDIVSPGTELGFGELPFNGADISYRQFDMKKVEKDTGYVNSVSFEEGIRMTFEWIKNEEKHG